MKMKKLCNRWASLMLSALLLAGSMASCQDEELPIPEGIPNDVTRTGSVNVKTGDGLVEQSNGYWKANCRVPLVGNGRIVDNLGVKVADVYQIPDGADKVVNTDISDSYTVQSVVGLEVGGSLIMSVRDLNYVYDGGQKAGFVCKANNEGVLDINILKSYWIETYLDGERTGQYDFNSEGVKSILDLGLGNITGGDYAENGTSPDNIFCIEATFDSPFDEIRLGTAGVDVNIVGSLEIYYAYVGDNEMIPAISSRTDFFENGVSVPWKIGDVSWVSWSDKYSAASLINDNLSDGCGIELIMGLLQPHVTVDFGREIEAGSEVGFVVTAGGLLDLSAGGTVVIRTYNGETEDPEKFTEQYTYTEIVSLGLLGGGQTKYSIKTTKPCRRVYLGFFGLNLNVLSGKTIHYAFVREPDKIDISSLFTLAGATVYTPGYRFADIPELPDGYTLVNKRYELVEKPYEDAQLGTNANGLVLTNMLTAGNYVVKGTFTYKGPDGVEHTVERTATIRRLAKSQNYCDNHLTNEEGENTPYSAYQPEGFDGLLTIGGGTSEGSLNNIVNADDNDYVQFTDAVDITVAENTGIIGVKSNQVLNSGKEYVRVGFVIDRTNSILSANILNFLRIKLLKNGQPVEEGVGKDNNGVSLSLLGVSTSGKARLSINTDKEFDAIELYASGLLKLGVGESLKVYYAFMENAKDTNCGAPGEECMQLITNANYGATAGVSSPDISVISVFDNLGNMLDGDMDSYATCATGVSLLGGKTLSVKFDPIAGGQEIGLIMSGVTGLLDLKAIGIEQIKALYEGKIVEETTNGAGVGLKVAGAGDRTYISIIPSEKVDELQFVWSSLAGVAGVINIHGAYLRPDYDLDGTMDCVDDNLTTQITTLKTDPENICEGNTTSLVVSGGEQGKTYQLVISAYEGEYNLLSETIYDVRINNSSELEFLTKDEDGATVVYDPIPDLTPGVYRLRIPNPNGQNDWINAVRLAIHPHETTWTGEVSDNWNEWGNWSNGVPWDCTNVFIPVVSTVYPDLREASAEEYWCDNIHFASGAELIGQSNLHYTQAFIDKNLEPNVYHLLSVPLQAMVTGDMFVAQNVSAWESWRDTETNGLHKRYFMTIDGTAREGENTGSAYVEQRRNPLVYQRFWSSEVRNETLTRALSTEDPAIVNLTDWSRSFNAVETDYEVGQGFAVKVEGQNGNAPTTDDNLFHFHFPKSFYAYNYYSVGSDTPVETKSVARQGETGRFWTEEEIGLMSLKRESDGELYLLGNPFMAHINVEAFLDANSSVTAVKIFDKNQKRYVDITRENTNNAQIAPMQAVFLQANAGTSYKVILTEDMLEQGNGNTSYVRAMPGQLSLTATTRGQSASCVIVPSSSANDGYDVREDATLLVGSEEGTDMAVYTVADGKALSIQRMNRAIRIPVGFYMKRTGDVDLKFEAGDDWSGWQLTDTQTGRSYPLEGTVSLDNVADGTGRFYLEKR